MAEKKALQNPLQVSSSIAVGFSLKYPKKQIFNLLFRYFYFLNVGQEFELLTIN